MIRYLLFIIFCFGLYPCVAQLDNTAFDQFQPIVAEDSNALYFGINALGFNKNNEYFSDIADGLTLFGYQFNPYFTYQAGKHFKLSGGAFLQKDFGNDDFTEIAPTFTVSYNFLQGRILFGTLEGSTSHRLVEPLYDFESVLIDRLENGLQFKIERPDLFIDLWIDWQNMIYRGDNDQEEVAGGVSFNKLLLDKSWKVELPLQLVAFHRGGQIDTSPLPLQTYFNSALGVALSKSFTAANLIQSFRFEGYHMYYKDFSNTQELTFLDGDGIYLNASIKTKIHLDIMASYWKSDEFLSFSGGQLYQSVSGILREPFTVESERQLLIVRFLHNLKISDNIFVSTRFEPYYDIENGLFEFSHGLYINYRPQFFLTRVKDHR
ncbi:hypothetical protein FNH22_16480 [Fulvivirga sp. M361]|uniref:hypothetical protein n=1 Tax=Fulvivirga sp. M361 TaxID=2594266 RepID=UPI00117A7B3C|nr:hypothetical protein [Fulvivirga sp. M361]TRX56234.1 hypothetical protein FNH22_16480 [Fulvivirga sp. M361]